MAEWKFDERMLGKEGKRPKLSIVGGAVSESHVIRGIAPGVTIAIPPMTSEGNAAAKIAKIRAEAKIPERTARRT